MLLRLPFLLLAGVLIFGCTRPPVPAPLAVSPKVPARLTPEPFSVAGRVLDAETGQPVPGITVRGFRQEEWGLQNWPLQAVTDAQGRFAYTAAVAPGDTSRFLLFLDALQYTGRAWCPVGPAPPTTILLHPRPPILLPPDSCRTSAEARLLNPHAAHWNIRSPWTAWYIDNAHSKAEAALRSVTLRGAPAGGLLEGWPLYFQLFAVNPATGGPGEAIFTEEAYVQFPEPGRAATYDLTPHQISIPPGGFYLVMAPVLSGNAARTLVEQEHYRPSGRLLRAPCAFADSRTWTHEQGHWQPLPQARNNWPLFESLITLEIDHP